MKGFYSPHETTTIVPGSPFDDGDWWAAQRDQALLLFRGTKLQAQFPRDLKVKNGESHPLDFLTSLGPEVDGKRLHSLYPLPDSVFTWHVPKAMMAGKPGLTPELKGGPSVPAPSTDEKEAPLPVEPGDFKHETNGQDPGTEQLPDLEHKQDTDQSRLSEGGSLELSETPVPVAKTEPSPETGMVEGLALPAGILAHDRKAVYVWQQGLDPGDKRARGILMGLKALQDFSRGLWPQVSRDHRPPVRVDL